jgi:hypothetical protein
VERTREILRFAGGLREALQDAVEWLAPVVAPQQSLTLQALHGGLDQLDGGPGLAGAALGAPWAKAAAVPGLVQRSGTDGRPDAGHAVRGFDRHLTEPIGWIQDFPSFSRFVTEWGDVVSQAARRDWAVIGLRS